MAERLACFAMLAEFEVVTACARKLERTDGGEGRSMQRSMHVRVHILTFGAVCSCLFASAVMLFLLFPLLTVVSCTIGSAAFLLVFIRLTRTTKKARRPGLGLSYAETID
jgi:Flp pilus assembly protein TadB